MSEKHLVFVKQKTFFPEGSTIDTFHHAMFHGLASRNLSDQASVSEACNIHSHFRAPLKLVVNGHCFPKILQPSHNLVVSEEVAKMLNDVPNLELLETMIDKVFEIPFAAGDFSHWDDPDYYDDGEVLEPMIRAAKNHKAGFKNKLPRYFEALMASYHIIRAKYEIQPVEIVFSANGRRAVLSFDPIVFETFPVCWIDGFFGFKQDLFSKTERFWDRDFFDVCSVRI